MRNILKKTAIATAVGLVCSTPAFAANYNVTLAAPGTQTVVLAEEIFGVNPAESNGQANLTLVTMPNIYVDLDSTAPTAATTLAGDKFATGESSTIQFILGGDAQWGEDISSTQLLACSNGGVGALTGTVTDNAAGTPAAGSLVPKTDCAGVLNVAGNGELQYEVTQGGAPTDNTITIKFLNVDTTPDDLWLQDLLLSAVKAKNLTNQLSPGSSSAHAVMFSSEYNAAPAVDLLASSENDLPIKIFSSKASVTLTATPLAADSIRRIAVASNQMKFTDVIPGITDFDNSTDVLMVGVGDVQASITTIVAADVDASNNVGGVIGTPIKGEDGLDFEYAGGDVHEMVLSGGNFNAYDTVGGNIHLNAFTATVGDFNVNNGKCYTLDGAAPYTPDPTTTTALAAGSVATIVASNDGTGTATFPLQGNTVALTTKYDICFVADGLTVIDEEAKQMDISYTVDYFNARYDNVRLEDGSFGPIQRNGCIASFFNIPPSGSADVAFVRLTNTSDASTGGVTGTLFAQDGTEIATGFDLLDGAQLSAHETGVFWSGDADVTSAQGRLITSIEDAAGIDNATAATTYVGRARLVASGAFPVCEALGLLRTGDGSLFNMTATTQGNNLKSGTDRGNNAN